MIAPIVYDISSSIEEFSLSKEEVESLSNYLIQKVSREYMLSWEKMVRNELSQTQDAYISGMRVEYPDSNSAVFILDGKGDGKLGLMIESGASAWDMKEGFEKSSKKKDKEGGGWYLTIPFREATSQAIASSNIFSSQIPEEIQEIAKANSGKALTSSDLPDEFKMKGVRKEITSGGKTFPKYEHKSPMYEGLKHTSKKNHGQYMKFRRVSDNSDDNSWTHPGFTARNFMERVLEEIDISTIFANATDDFINKVR